MSKQITILASTLVVGLTSILSPAIGQETSTNKDSLTSETVVIVREFEPVIKDAKKINHQPMINTVEKAKPDFKYELMPQNQSYEFTPDTIDAVKIKGEPLTTLHRAYLKAGMGSYLNNYGELHINSLRSRDFQWGLDVHHLGSNGGVPDAPESYFSKQNVDLYGKKMLKRHAINAGFIFDREQINKYGVPKAVDENLVIPDSKQTYELYEGRAGIRSFISDSNELNYIVNFKYHNLAVKPYSTTENNFLMTSQFSKFYGKEKAYLFLDVDYNKLNTGNDIFDYKPNLLVKPSIAIEFKGEKWHLNAGFKMALEDGNDTRFYFFPKAEFKYNVVGNLVVPYMGVTGGAKRNSFNSLRQENPFLFEYSELKTTRTAYDVYVGVRGLISSNLSYNVSGGYKAVKDMVLYTSDLTPRDLTQPYYENVFMPVYDTVNVAHFSSQIGYQQRTKWNVLWRLNYNLYETQREIKAWNLPDLTTDITINYNLQEKILVKSSITYMNSKYVKTSDTSQEELAFGVYGRKIDPIIDFNIGLEYRFTKKVSAFLDVNNILSQNYEIWGNYRVQGINVLGGVTIAFWAK
ncbi:MAG: hypothetical protein ACPGD5_05600 [Salibacteraceae bacterium]